MIGSTTSPSLSDSGPFEDEPWDGVSTIPCGYYGPLLYVVDSEVVEATLNNESHHTHYLLYLLRDYLVDHVDHCEFRHKASFRDTR